jgi:hypothetical protein
MNVNDILASKWAGVNDFPPQGVDLQILNVTAESVGEMLEQKVALHLSAGFKPVLLNRTNLQTLAGLYGPDTNGWIGKPVNVFADHSVMYAGKQVGGVRVRRPVAQAAQPQATAAQYRQASGAVPGDLKDDMPW